MSIAGLLIATFLSNTAWIDPPPDAPKVEQPVPPVTAKGNEARQPIKSKITAGKDTTYFTGPIDKNGYVDYITALNNHLKKGVTPENNANVLFLRAMGTKSRNGPRSTSSGWESMSRRRRAITSSAFPVLSRTGKKTGRSAMILMNWCLISAVVRGRPRIIQTWPSGSR